MRAAKTPIERLEFGLRWEACRLAYFSSIGHSTKVAALTAKLQRLEQKRNTQAELRTGWRSCIKDGTTRSGQSFQYAYSVCLNNVISKARDIGMDSRDLMGQYQTYIPVIKDIYNDILLWQKHHSLNSLNHESIKIDCKNTTFSKNWRSGWKMPPRGSIMETAMTIYCSNP